MLLGHNLVLCDHRVGQFPSAFLDKGFVPFKKQIWTNSMSTSNSIYCRPDVSILEKGRWLFMYGVTFSAVDWFQAFVNLPSYSAEFLGDVVSVINFSSSNFKVGSIYQGNFLFLPFSFFFFFFSLNSFIVEHIPLWDFAMLDLISSHLLSSVSLTLIEEYRLFLLLR